MSDHGSSEEAAFQGALNLPVSDRPAFLQAACGNDVALRNRVDALLAVHEGAGSFLEKPVMEDFTQTFRSDKGAIAEGPGELVGRYKLLQQIGEGGIGVVYMADQESPVRRRVALKIIKPGMDSAQVIARFEAERQALAMMDHPHIAKVLDAGTTNSGRPYFVMELVQGVPITQHCDTKRLTLRERLELFVLVCQAVQHAHQKGVIHRDLKPSNVLVAIFDGKPMPKVIDFGVAKALHQRLTEKTLFTQFGGTVGTPEYMSPEQTDVDMQGTDTRSDIYTLGVLLYELLTGTTPLNVKKLQEQGYARMMQLIRDVEPLKPSTRLHNSGEALAAISASRGIEPRKLARLLAGDLDWIVMKALEKDRSRRYETVNGLARDIQRYLSHETVEATPPNTWRRMRKLAKRYQRTHRTPLRVLTAFAVLLITGTIVIFRLDTPLLAMLLWLLVAGIIVTLWIAVLTWQAMKAARHEQALAEKRIAELEQKLREIPDASCPRLE